MYLDSGKILYVDSKCTLRRQTNSCIIINSAPAIGPNTLHTLAQNPPRQPAALPA